MNSVSPAFRLILVLEKTGDSIQLYLSLPCGGCHTIRAVVTRHFFERLGLSTGGLIEIQIPPNRIVIFDDARDQPAAKFSGLSTQRTQQ